MYKFVSKDSSTLIEKLQFWLSKNTFILKTSQELFYPYQKLIEFDQKYIVKYAI